MVIVIVIMMIVVMVIVIVIMYIVFHIFNFELTVFAHSNHDLNKSM